MASGCSTKPLQVLHRKGDKGPSGLSLGFGIKSTRGVYRKGRVAGVEFGLFHVLEVAIQLHSLRVAVELDRFFHVVGLVVDEVGSTDAHVEVSCWYALRSGRWRPDKGAWMFSSWAASASGGKKQILEAVVNGLAL